MKNKGFTVVELIVSFCLVTAISIMLFQIIISLKELYISGDIKTTLLNKQGIMERKIYDDLNSDTLTNIDSCGVSCLKFTYNNGKEKKLLIDVASNTLIYDTYSMKLIKGSYFGQVSFENNENVGGLAANKNSIFTIDIPIESKLLPDEDFGIHIVKSYRFGSITIDNDLAIADATIVANGVSLPLIYLCDTDPNVTNCEDRENYPETGHWLQILHQKENVYFSTHEEFLKSKNSDKLSSLISLETFRIISINERNAIIEDLILHEENPEEVRESMEKIYQKGYFEFLLQYNSESFYGGNNNISHFIQTSNFALEDDLAGTYIIQSDSQGLIWKNTDNAFVYGQNENEEKYSIGVKQGFIKDAFGNNANNMSLYIRVDEYITKYSLSNITH